MTPAKVTFVLPNLAPGGAERVFLTLLNHLDRRQFTPTLVLLQDQAGPEAGPLRDDVRVVRLRRPKARDAALALVLHAWRERPRAIISTIAHVNFLMGALRPVLPPSVSLIGRESVTASAAIASGFLPGWAPAAYRWLLPRLDHVICQSQAMRNDLIEHLGFPADRAAVIHNPVDLEAISQQVGDRRPAPHEAGLRLVAAGRLTPIKGFDLLVDAMAQCPDLPLTLDLLGDGPERGALQARVEAAGLGARVRLRGHVASPFKALAEAHAFVLSSRMDAFPNAVLEALACGTPVVAVPCPGGIREILAGQPGCVLADDVSAEGLAAALRRWVAMGPRRVPPAGIAHFGVERVVRQYEALILQVIGHAPRP
jgi:glycosyltransferase involved in cell wall biosynthesis